LCLRLDKFFSSSLISGRIIVRRFDNWIGRCHDDARVCEREGVKMSEPNEIMQGTGQGLAEFLERAATRGDLNQSTARAMRSSVRKIIGVESEDLSSVDVRQLDVDDLLDRFTKLHRAEYSDGSMETYRSRFRLGIAMYLAWLDNDPDWKSAGRAVPAKRPSRQRASTGRPDSRKPKEKPDVADPTPPQQSPAQQNLNAPGARVMTYDVPLRPDLIVRLTLPIDLTETDAKRLSSFIDALAFSGPVGSEKPSDAREA
jgi:hypothetical protein